MNEQSEKDAIPTSRDAILTEIERDKKRGIKVREGYYSERIRNLSFQEIYDELGDRQQLVYETIKKNEPISSEEIAEMLHVYPHVICPRVKELRDLGLVRFHSISKSVKSYRRVSLWETVPQSNQLGLFSPGAPCK